MNRLCDSASLPEGTSRGFTLGKVLLFAVRRHRQVHVYLNRCPHQQVALEWQPDAFLDDSGSLIRCARHGALFLIESGECVAGPCSGESLQSVPCEERNGAVWVSLDIRRDS